jgi:hypothetical protein
MVEPGFNYPLDTFSTQMPSCFMNHLVVLRFIESDRIFCVDLRALLRGPELSDNVAGLERMCKV